MLTWFSHAYDATETATTRVLPMAEPGAPDPVESAAVITVKDAYLFLSDMQAINNESNSVRNICIKNLRRRFCKYYSFYRTDTREQQL